MRKVLAVVLTVLMLAGAVAAALPAFAATSSFDSTTNSSQIDLVITEVLINSSTHNELLDDQVADGSVAVTSSPDAFDFIEIYNRGNTPVNIYDYAILSANAANFAGDNKEYDATVNAQNKYMFTMKNLIVPGSIHSTAASAASGSLQDYNECINPERAQGVIAPGEFAVIWFWTSATDTLCKTLGEGGKVGEMHENDSRTFPYFRDTYNIDDSVKIFATNAKTSSGSIDMFNDLRNGWIYALVNDAVGTGQLGVNSKAVTVSGSKKTLSPRIACMAEYSTGTAVGIVTTDNMDDQSAYYVPANSTPDLYNANQKNIVDSNNEDALASAKAAAEAKNEAFDEAAFKASDKWKTFVPAEEFVTIQFAQSFMETAIVSFTEKPTPGGMPAWQWMYVDPATAGTTYQHGLPVLEAKIFAEAADTDEFNERMAKLVTDWETNTDIKTAEGRLLAETGENSWQTKALSNFLTNYVAEIEEEEDNEETKKDYSENFVSREELEDKHKDTNKKKPTTNKDGGVNIGLILGIVGGVVALLLIVAVVIVIVVVKGKKKKAKAADDVASEGEILVIDETVEAPVEGEEAPVAEEAPVEEVPEDKQN